jgi:hypothetical protein
MAHQQRRFFIAGPLREPGQSSIQGVRQIAGRTDRLGITCRSRSRTGFGMIA